MSAIVLQLRAGQRIAVFDEAGHAELIDIDHERDEAGVLIVTDHVLIKNRFGVDGIYDDVAAYLRGEPVQTVPANTHGAANENMTPALLERSAPAELYRVA